MLAVIEARLLEAQAKVAELERRMLAAPAILPQTSGFIMPSAPKLASLESQATVRAWIANVERFCADLHIPDAQKLVWAASGLENDAAST